MYRLATEVMTPPVAAEFVGPEAGATIPDRAESADREPAAMVELRELMGRARAGDSAAMPWLAAIFDARPEVWAWAGNLASYAEEALIRLACGPDLGMAEAIRRKVVALRAELVGPTPTPIDRLLADRVVVTWLHLNWAESAVAGVMGDASRSIRQVSFGQEQLDRAQRRHLAALAALATAKRLLPAAKAPATAIIEKDAACTGRSDLPRVDFDGPARPEPDADAVEPRPLGVFPGPPDMPASRVPGSGRKGGRRRSAF